GLQQSPRGIQPLYLRCTQGRIKWYYPRGALRVLLRPPLSTFQGCVRIAANSTGARLYLEGEKKLYPLYKAGDGKPEDLHRCFTSRKSQVALYVEADPPLDILKKDTIEFTYDLMPQKNLADDMEECRPCSDDEILQSFCTSDFVIQGTVSALHHNPEAQTSELNIRASAIIRNNPHKSWSNAKYVTLYRPLKCGTKAGMGEFLFLGRWRLGQPVIHCAPRLSHWKEIRRKAISEGTSQCHLPLK
ncbi:meteorin-like protein, partial [Stegodyphus dumicola]|uniref:meteorin-like protein n=1 Tax=Stegodyphus dumicola TaxID=202533 RepID=UPI0015AE9E0A